MHDLYSDRLHGPKPRSETSLSKAVEVALQNLVLSYKDRDFFGVDFPETCPDNNRPIGTNFEQLDQACIGLVPELNDWRTQIRNNYSQDIAVPQEAILDGLEWYARHVGEPQNLDFHDFFSHHHKAWDKVAGSMKFRHDINEIFARNGIAFEMNHDGLIVRLVEGPAANQLRSTQFDSGDPKTNELLELAKKRFFDRDHDAGQRSIEALWDAFERVKTHIDSSNKKSSANLLIIQVGTSDQENALLKDEMLALTKIGNDWRIRHHELDKHEMGAERDLRDYLFLRMFSLLQRIVPKRHVQ